MANRPVPHRRDNDALNISMTLEERLLEAQPRTIRVGYLYRKSSAQTRFSGAVYSIGGPVAR